MLIKNPFSDLILVSPGAGDLVAILQKQTDGSFKNKLAAFPGKGSSGIIGSLIGANFNTSNEQIIQLVGGTKFIPTLIRFRNPSIPLCEYDVITSNNQVGTFIVGEQLQGNFVSGYVFETSMNNLKCCLGGAQVGEVITGAISGATMTVLTVNHSSNAFQNGNIKTGPGNTGLVVGTLQNGILANSDMFFDIVPNSQNFTINDKLYFKITTPLGLAATADIYIYGEVVG